MKIVSSLLVVLFLLTPVAQAFASGHQDKAGPSVEQVKIQIAKLGTGDKAKATITTKNGAKVKGYVSQAGDDDFVMRDRKTGAPTTVRYADVTKVDRNRGHSVAKIVLIAVGAGTAIVLGSIFLAIARNER